MLRRSHLRELQRIADADDPQKELERIRKMTRERVERHRKKKKSAPLRNDGTTIEAAAELEDDRKRLIEWARNAPLDRVAKVLSDIEQSDAAAAIANPDEAAEPAVP